MPLVDYRFIDRREISIEQLCNPVNNCPNKLYFVDVSVTHTKLVSLRVRVPLTEEIISSVACMKNVFLIMEKYFYTIRSCLL